MNDHCGRTTVQPSDGLSVPTNQNLQGPTQTRSAGILSRAPAPHAGVMRPFSTVGLGPDSNSLKDMDNLPQINPLACAGAGGAAGHADAVCVSACCEGAGASVYDARDASVQCFFSLYFTTTSCSSTVHFCSHENAKKHSTQHKNTGARARPDNTRRATRCTDVQCSSI